MCVPVAEWPRLGEVVPNKKRGSAMMETLYVIWAHRPGESCEDDRPIGQFRTETDAKQSFAAARALGWTEPRIVVDDGSPPDFRRAIMV